tara:strand:+ start:4361 stop:5269 length:909 start_codon:yes stop_codon:yes gene_type:complete
MKKVFITGGTGTIGKSFIEKYYDTYEFYSLSRNEKLIAELKHEFPKVKCYVGSICNGNYLLNLFEKIKPDIVIHSAAMKHINLAEENPFSAVTVNINGSINVANASLRAKVPLTIAISTDKACNPDSTYGYTKKLMEQVFSEYHSSETKFVCTRFANVAKSNGSVIPYWLSENEKGNQLKLTDTKMNRLMFSKEESAELIHKCIDYVYGGEDKFFILSSLMKNVNLYSLAKLISPFEVEVIGRRPGEKLNETLISEKELKFTKLDGKFILLYNEVVDGEKLDKEYSSLSAETMTDEEMKNLL